MHIIDRKDWADSPEEWKGELECAAYGADVSLIFNLQTERGGGPPGQIVIVPADTPHKFTNAGHAPLETIDIHASGRFITEWLE